jgi:hypothetical protein
MEYTHEDIGKIVEVTASDGTYIDERVVTVHCSVCGASFIGLIRHAGGFLAGHTAFHTWEFQMEMEADNGMTT